MAQATVVLQFFEVSIMATKQASRRKRADKTSNMKLLCSALLEERNQLRNELQQAREENDQLKRSLGALLCEDIEIDKRALLAQFGKEPSLAELIAEFERAGD
jgi:transposase-like protein